MNALLALYFDQFVVFVLVLSRIGGLVSIAPIFGSRAIPMRIRAFLAASLAFLITPLHWGQAIEVPQSLLGMALLVAQDFGMGLVLGLGVLIVLSGLQISGQMLGQMSGMQLADIVDPSLGNSVPVFSQLLDLVTLAVFVIIGGHRLMLGALLETFQWAPPGDVQLPPGIVAALTELITQSFVLGVRAAAPGVVALLLAVLVMGLISRTLPQLNVLAVGFSLNALIMLAVLSISLGAAAWLFQEQLDPTLMLLVRTLASGTI